jgi:hypothetical protein
MSGGGSGEANIAGAATAVATSIEGAPTATAWLSDDSADDVSLAESEPDDAPDFFEPS